MCIIVNYIVSLRFHIKDQLNIKTTTMSYSTNKHMYTMQQPWIKVVLCKGVILWLEIIHLISYMLHLYVITNIQHMCTCMCTNDNTSRQVTCTWSQIYHYVYFERAFFETSLDMRISNFLLYTQSADNSLTLRSS